MAEAGLDADVAAPELIVLVTDLIQIVAYLLYFDDIFAGIQSCWCQQIFHLNGLVILADGFRARFRLVHGIEISDVINALGMSH